MSFHHTGGHAPPYAIEPDTLDAIRRDLDGLPEVPPIEPETAAEARRLYERRQLYLTCQWALVCLDPFDFGPLAIDILEGTIEEMDALDGDTDAEDGQDAEGTLGWTDSVSQLDLGDGTEDGEHSLGAPERHPWVASMTHPLHAPARGGRLQRCFGRNAWNQVRWAQGEGHDGEAEAEAGYDLPEGDDERDEDKSDFEPSIGWPEDYTARVTTLLGSSFDAEADDADMEDDGPRATVCRPLGLCEPKAADLVARARAKKCGTALLGDGLARPWLTADRVFGLHVEGDCCAPEILNNGSVHVDKDARPVAGDFVAIWFEVERAGRHVMIGWVKRLLFDLPRGMRFPFRPSESCNVIPLVDVGALNPPRRYGIPASRVHAVFKVVRIIPPAAAIAARLQSRGLRT